MGMKDYTGYYLMDTNGYQSILPEELITEFHIPLFQTFKNLNEVVKHWNELTLEEQNLIKEDKRFTTLVKIEELGIQVKELDLALYQAGILTTLSIENLY